jgi:hypothetical protein
MAFSTSAVEKPLDKVLTVIIVFAILGGTATVFFTNLKSLVTAFNNTSATGNTTVDGFISIFGLIVAVVGVFALIRLVQNSTHD